MAAGSGRIRIAKESGMSIAATPACGRINEVVVYFLRLGLVGFGGPVALVGQMERELVTERKWLTKEQMREAIAICQSLPPRRGPSEWRWIVVRTLRSLIRDLHRGKVFPRA